MIKVCMILKKGKKSKCNHKGQLKNFHGNVEKTLALLKGH